MSMGFVGLVGRGAGWEVGAYGGEEGDLVLEVFGGFEDVVHYLREG
jgi:hypothetical protein